MLTLRFRRSLVLVSALLFSGHVWADSSHNMPPYEGSKAFREVKALAGHWTGTAKEEGKDEPTSVTYRVTSNGSAVIETIFEDTPMEMTSIYFEENGKLMMTHYCAMANRPTLTLKEEKPGLLAFDYVDTKGINPKKDTHIHKLALETKPDGSLVQRWTGFQNGTEAPATVLTLKRAS